jgi:hypothetical protein
MESFLSILLVIALFAVAGVLFAGVAGMARGGEFNRKYANKLMRWRIALQAGALVIIFALLFVMQS